MVKRNVYIVLLVIVFGVSGSRAEEPVFFADLNLKTVVETELWLFDPTPTDMLGLTSLTGSGEDIKDLTGLEYALNLQSLTLTHNELKSLKPLEGLTGLRTLIVNNNSVGDLRPLAGLTQLRHLDIHENRITDISSLADLTKIKELNLHANYFSDLSALANMTKLQYLYLNSCRIEDISSLEELTELRYLDVRTNMIRDISALLDMQSLYRLYLSNNPLNEAAYQHHLQTMIENNPGLDLLYDPNVRPPEDITASLETYPDHILVTWNEVANGPHFISYYRVFRSVSSDGQRDPVGDWQTDTTFVDTSVQPGMTYNYWVRTATSDKGLNAGGFGQSVQGRLLTEPTLTIESTAGGNVTVPGEGVYVYTFGESVLIQAVPVDTDLFEFAGWTGSAVDKGKVVAPDQMITEVILDEHIALRANFTSRLNTIMVKGGIPDPNEDGTPDHPFDRIQEAIEVAHDGTVIQVASGYYRENLDCLGKSIQLVGIDPNTPDQKPYPVIDGNDTGPVISITQGEGPECVLMGLVLTGGEGAIVCHDSSPTLAHCLMVGNGPDELGMAAVNLFNSRPRLINCTIADNLGLGLNLWDSDPIITNTILWGNTLMQIAVGGTSQPIIRYCDIAGGWNQSSVFDLDPLFVRNGQWNMAPLISPVWSQGDYHLQSPAGHWSTESQTWIADLLMSPCIDAGNLVDPVGFEPAPNGSVINMGAYGGTAQASQSP